MTRIIVIGAVTSTLVTLKKLIQHEFDVVGVLGHEPENKSRVSGLVDLKTKASEYKISYKGFLRINDIENVKWAHDKEPDIIFAVGFSQLLSKEWLSMARLGCIGFHPTKLPKGRGRAPIAWLILEENVGAANFFLMGEGADDGPIFVQEEFPVEPQDNAKSIEQKILGSIDIALDKWLPDLKKGIWDPKDQDEIEASWYGRRTPEDGWINWNDSALLIDRLIKASSHPHPGAYTYFRDSKLLIWDSVIEDNIPIKGVIGGILLWDEVKGYLVQCGGGLLWLKGMEGETLRDLKVGHKLGYNVEDEIHYLKQIIKKIGRYE